MYSDRCVKPAIRATCGSVTTQRQPERGIHTSQVSIVVPSRTAEINKRSDYLATPCPRSDVNTGRGEWPSGAARASRAAHCKHCIERCNNPCSVPCARSQPVGQLSPRIVFRTDNSTALRSHSLTPTLHKTSNNCEALYTMRDKLSIPDVPLAKDIEVHIHIGPCVSRSVS